MRHFSRGLSLLFLAHLVLAFTACREKQRRPNRYLIPDGYVGWVKVDFTVKDAPALPIEDGFFLTKFPSSGYLQTSSSPEFGWATDEYYYYSGTQRKPIKDTGWGEGGMVWGRSNGSVQGSDRSHEYFFVGSEQEFKEIGLNHKDENGRPKVGPILH